MKTHTIPKSIALAMIAGALWMPTSHVLAQPAATYSPVQQTLGYDIRYFIPEMLHAAGQSTHVSYKFRADIPQPKDILGFEVGEQYADWNDVLKYIEAVQKHSDRVKVEVMGKTYENRPIIQMLITSPENLKKLEQIKKEHLQLTDASVSAQADIKGVAGSGILM